MKYFSVSILALLICTIIYSCQKDVAESTRSVVPSLPAMPYQYDVMTASGNVFSNVDDDAATLGRVLFYDEKLSANGSTSCGSCHHQDRGFAENVANSKGFRFASTPRNSMAIVSPSMKVSFFWDGRENVLEEQVLLPIENHIEMGINDFDALISVLQNTEYYPPLFEAAYGDGEITSTRMADALESFISCINPYQTKFDAGFSPNNNEFNTWETPEILGLTALEDEGLKLFFEEFQCISCHSGKNFDGGGWAVANIGLDMEYEDGGFATWTGNETDAGVFLVPTLRNLELTAPYMHDGRFSTLDEVLNHYSSGIKPHPNLDWNLRVLPEEFDDIFIFEGDLLGILLSETQALPVEAKLMNMTDHQKEALKAFLGTLTDHQMEGDVRFSYPFVLKE